jgi:hypothetical protein
MYIYIDTNIFYNNYQLTSTEFKQLANFISNSGATLLISKVVLGEVQNEYEKERDKNLADAISAIQRFSRFNQASPILDLPAMVREYEFTKTLQEKFDGVKLLDYSHIPPELTVYRAIKRVKPFGEHDKGYRDTLIWISLLDFLETARNRREVFFVNNNKSDFYAKDSEEFHADLAKDIAGRSISNKFRIHESLRSFINEMVKDQHDFVFEEVYQRHLVDCELKIEKELQLYLNYLKPPDFVALLEKHHGNFSELKYLREHDFEIIDGIEDPKVIGCQKIAEDSLIITYEGNIRVAEMRFDITEKDYLEDKLIIDVYYDSVAVEDGIVTLLLYKRIDFKISFEFYTELETVDNMTVSEIKLR